MQGNNLDLSTPLSLPCGAVIKNRLAKSAMSENMGDANFNANAHLENLYEAWAKGGAGLLITGNVMCDSRALGEPHNVVIEKDTTDLEALRKWAKAGTIDGTHLWMQINHPGRQSPKFLSATPVAPSSIALKAPLDRVFNRPRALSEEEIVEVISRFADAAELAKKTGFTGVQIHGAHGYLVAQFLSPLSNIRTDRWGGSLENRMRFVLEIYRGMRERVGKEFPIGIKLNSADFQRGGFTEEESLEVMQRLDQEGIDLFEISGGSYESQVMMKGDKSSTQKREAYFLDFAAQAKRTISAPLIVTGGFRSHQAMNSALVNNELDMVGLARSVAIDPNFPSKILANDGTVSQVKPLTSGMRWLDNIVPIEITWYTQQLHRMGRGLSPDPTASVLMNIMGSIKDIGWQSLKRVRSK
jgi:2,4-dienoyl-CoA reductase-like NADH-dependent reductase (Old Yellow Enzyme family)